MKKDKIAFWTTTALVATGMILSAFMYLTKNPDLMSTFKTLGYPEYFVSILGTAKLIGAIVLLAPVSHRLKEWAYAGFLFTFIGATWTHVATGTAWFSPVIFLMLLATSYLFWTRVNRTMSGV